MADRQLTIVVDVDNQAGLRNLKATDSALNDVGKSGVAAGKGVDQMTTALLKTEGVKEGLRAIEQGMENIGKFAGASIAAFSQQEDALKRLTTALSAQGTATPAVIAQYEQMAATFQRTTVFSDELVQEMQALLVQVGNVMPDQMQGALKAATDLSAGLGIDLRTATLLVGKAFEGETGTLKRYGIVIDENKLKTEGATAVMEAINAKFGGQAQAQIETYTGKTAVLTNQMDEFREKVGTLLVNALTPLLNVFLSMPQSVQTVTFLLGALVVTLGPLALGFGSIMAALGPLMPVLVTALPAALAALGALLVPAGLIIGGIVGVYLAFKHWDDIKAIANRVYDGVKYWMVDQFQAIVNSIKAKVDAVTGFFQGMYDKVVGHSIVPDMIKGIEREFAKLHTVMVEPTEEGTTSIEGLFQKSALKIGSLFGGEDSLLGKLVGGGLSMLFAGPLMDIVGKGVNALVNLAWEGVKKIGSFFSGLFRGGEEGTQVNPARDAWFAGRSVEELGLQLGDVGHGGEEARQMIEAVFKSHTMGDFRAATDAIDTLLHPTGHTGGFIDALGLERYHRGGLLPDERVIVAQTGEGILNRQAMAQLGTDRLHAMNRGDSAGASVVNHVNVYVDGELNSPMARRKAVRAIKAGIEQDIRYTRKFAAR